MAKISTGLDYAWAPHPDETKLKGLGYNFVSRYLSWLPNGKVITSAERQKLHQNGISISLNWEYDIDDAQGGASNGTKMANEAVKQAQALGYPKGCTLYFSVDQDTTASGAVKDYLAAARSIVRASGYRMGAYGGYRLIKSAFDQGLIDDGWQTYAWSGGQWDPRAGMRQVKNGVNVMGADCDLNEQHGAISIWWPGRPNTRLDGSPIGSPPAPSPTPTPAPGPPSSYNQAFNAGYNASFNQGFQSGYRAGWKARG